MQAEVRNPKWRFTNRKYLYLALYTSLLKNSKSNSHIAEVNGFEKAIYHTVWCKRKSEIQDGGFKQEILIAQQINNIIEKFLRL